MDYEIIRINHNSWRIEDSGVRFFLLVGTERALLVDSGRNIRNARDIAASLTDLPILLVNTHADRDHVASNCQFWREIFWISENANWRLSIFLGTHREVSLCWMWKAVF